MHKQSAAPKARRPAVKPKSVALPSEHGSWGLLAEPILLGLLVAFSWPGVLLGLAAVGFFLIHQPLKIALKDRLKGRRPPRLVWAERFALGYGLLGVVPLLYLVITQPLGFLLPLGLALPLAGVQLAHDAQNRSRRLLPEICGAAALAMVAPSIALLGGWLFWPAMLLWLILAVRALTAVYYVRARIKQRHGKPAQQGLVWLLHGTAVVLFGTLALLGSAPWLLLLPFVVLLGRALWGLSPYQQPQSMKRIGFQELAYGLGTVLCAAIAFWIM